MTNFVAGCLPYIKDPRDYNFGDLVSGGGSFPSKYISPLPGFILNQGATMMCVSYAIAMARYMYELNDSGNAKQFSPAYAYANRASGDFKGEGMYIRQALNCLNNNGICYLKTLNYSGPYKDVYNKYISVKTKADTEAKPFRISSFYGIYNDDQIKQAIVSTGCAIASYNLFDNWYNVSTNGKMDSNYGTNHGGHCVLIVGWTESREWIILNSWGETWGDKGLAYVPMSVPKNEAWCMLDNIQEVFFKSVKDINNHWAMNSINKAIQTGVLKGYEDGTFRPDNSITRAEACAIISKITNYDGRSYYGSQYIDIKKDDWFFVSVCWSSQNKYVSGYNDNTFKPNKALTRAEVCKILCAVGNIHVGFNTTTNKFSDLSNHWSLSWVAAMVNAGYIKGYEDGTFRPENSITRAEFITILDRMGLLNK